MIELTFDATGLRRWAQLRWSLADPVASVAINMALQKVLFASSQLPRRRVQDAYKAQRGRAHPVLLGHFGGSPRVRSRSSLAFVLANCLALVSITAFSNQACTDFPKSALLCCTSTGQGS